MENESSELNHAICRCASAAASLNNSLRLLGSIVRNEHYPELWRREFVNLVEEIGHGIDTFEAKVCQFVFDPIDFSAPLERE